MAKRYITQEQYQDVLKAIKENKNKLIDKRLKVIKMRYEGFRDCEIGEKLGYHRKRVSQIVSEFLEEGIEKFSQNQYGGNSQKLSYEAEEEFLKEYTENAENGHILTVSDMWKNFTQTRTDITLTGFYLLLRRHKWRKIKPRGRHPKKASEADIDTAKNKISFQ